MKKPALLGSAICWISLLVLPGTPLGADPVSSAPPWSIGSPAAAGSGSRFGLGLLYDWEELDQPIAWEMSTTGIQLPLALSCFRMKSSACLFPTLTLEAASADVTLDTSLHGSGDLFGAGLDVTVAFCDSCPGFAGGGYRFRTIPGLDLSSDGTRKNGGRARLSRDSHMALARLGYVLPGNRFAPYLGLRGQWREAEMEDSGRSPDGSFLITRTKLESTVTEGILGVDTRLWGSLFGRLEIMAGGQDKDCGVQVSLAYVGPRRARPGEVGYADTRENITERAEAGKQTEERAREIADAITPQLERILANFTEARRNLPVDTAATGGPVFPLGAVSSLLDDTERELLAALPGAELTAMRDYVQDLFRQARIGLGLLLGPQSALEPSPPVRLASLSMQPGRPAPASIDKAAADSWLNRIGEAIEKILDHSRNNDLVLDLCVKSSPKSKANFRMRPISYEPPIPVQVNTNRRLPNIWRGLYTYTVNRRGFKQIQSTLDLVMSSDPVIDCELVTSSGEDEAISCNPRSGRVEEECPE